MDMVVGRISLPSFLSGLELNMIFCHFRYANLILGQVCDDSIFFFNNNINYILKTYLTT